MCLGAHGPVLGGYPPSFENKIRKGANFLGVMCLGDTGSYLPPRRARKGDSGAQTPVAEVNTPRPEGVAYLGCLGGDKFPIGVAKLPPEGIRGSIRGTAYLFKNTTST